MELKTKRLILRKMNPEDYNALYAVLADRENMRYYPYGFDEARVRDWIGRNMERYRIFGFGLWAVCLRETGEVIGDCGLTMQEVGGVIRPEIGYHIRADLQRNGFAKEASIAVRDWAFETLPFNEICSCMSAENEPSANTARSWGCRFVGEFEGGINEKTKVFALTRAQWNTLRRERARIGTAFIREERISPEEYIDFLRRSDLGSQYPKERFQKRIETLTKSVPISLAARTEEGLLVGVLFALTDYAYWMFVTDLGVARGFERRGIGTVLMKTAHELAGGEKDIAVYTVAEENAVPFYRKLGMKHSDDVMQYFKIDWTNWTVE